MSTFTTAEIDYVTSQPLGRFATVGKDGRPHVTPVGVFYDPDTETIVIGCVTTMTSTKKFRDTQANPDVAVVVDDLATIDPWAPRGIEIRGRAEAVSEGGSEVGRRLGAGFPFDEVYLTIRPRRIVAWGIDGAAVTRDVA